MKEQELDVLVYDKIKDIPPLPPLVIIFGRSGSGKHTYISEHLKSIYGYYIHDGNSDYTPEMKDNFRTKTLHSMEQRDEHARNMIRRITELQVNRPRVALVQSLVMERQRLILFEAFPDAKFFYAIAPKYVREFRVIERQGHHVKSDYAAKLEDVYEEPRLLPHSRLINDTPGPEKIADQLKSIFFGSFTDRLLARLRSDIDIPYNRVYKVELANLGISPSVSVVVSGRAFRSN